MIDKLGFTGSRNGMTPAQREVTVDLVAEYYPRIARHGDCIGSDDEFDDICQRIGINRHISPCIADLDLKAMCHLKRPVGVIKVDEPIRPFARNRDIVEWCDHLIACPPTQTPLNKGGTWYTIKYAQKLGKPVTVILPDGTINGT